MKHSIEDIKRLLAEADGDGIPVFNPHAIIRDLLAEVERLDAENLELNAGLAEFTVIHQALKDSEAQLKAAESLAAERLADQESIEKHTAQVCAEIVDKHITECVESGECAATVISNDIRKRYGVES